MLFAPQTSRECTAQSEEGGALRSALYTPKNTLASGPAFLTHANLPSCHSAMLPSALRVEIMCWIGCLLSSVCAALRVEQSGVCVCVCERERERCNAKGTKSIISVCCCSKCPPQRACGRPAPLPHPPTRTGWGECA
uniref:Uncharacterized protein n=1 Tax=Gasterosteus aculeatus TaxID=69293 RepID=G3NBW2_GASAC